MMEAEEREFPFCIYSTKLLHLYILCSRALRKLLQQEIDKQNVGNFANFLNNNAETLFHLRGIKCCCNKREYVVLNKEQWNSLFTRSTSSIQCPRNQQNCFHTYKAWQYLTVDKVDFSLACVLLRNICDSTNKESIMALQLHRNQFVHNPSPLDQDEFELQWNKTKTSLSNVINDKELKEQICKKADVIYNFMFRDMLTRYIGKMSRFVKQEELPSLRSSNVPMHDNLIDKRKMFLFCRDYEM